MSAITSTGVGSGLDIESLVTKLVASEGQAPTARLKTKGTKLQANLSALGQLKSALANFQASVQGLTNASVFQARTATSSNTTSFTVSATPSAAPTNLSITVNSLAQSAISRSVDFSSDTALVGAGTLAINLGASSFNIATDGTTTLAGVRDAINQATGNPGIQATIIKVDSGSQLVLSSNVLGAANTIGIVATDTDPLDGGDLTRFATTNLVSVQAAQDASISVAGQLATRSSNSISDVIPGVTLSLIKADPVGGNLMVALDKNPAQSKINDFITAYNALTSTMSALTSYNPQTKIAGPLLGDSTLRSVQNQISQALSNPMQGGVAGFSTLADIGITRSKDGVLGLDAIKFNNAITLDFTAVSTLFTSSNGLAANLDTVLTNSLSSTSSISTRVAGTNKAIGNLAKEQDKLNVKLAAIEARYRKQFNAMDSLMGKMQATGSYLNQQFFTVAKN
ncbi:flagellar filament capping protein FliD [Methylobacter svalbardensis]|uniref:flagellar filament capping protein FliD n=1 Tax=Methylobacter svalbardensis TaxID=3080016 RepID=UPI0030EC405A